MIVLFIIDFVKVSSGALVYVVVKAIEDVVKLAHALGLRTDFKCCSNF